MKEVKEVKRTFTINNKLLGSEKISTGTLDSSIVHPRDVMKKAIQYGSDRLILAHNHPSGDPLTIV
ncbi:JAB domain-containing protein [Streptococcus parasuis]